MMNFIFQFVFCFCLPICYCGYGGNPDHKNFSDQLIGDKCIILAEQSQQRIAVVNTAGDIVWEWRAESSNINPLYRKWFDAPSDAKIVYNGRYMLLCASGGGVALVRISDKKTVFYAFAGGNTHSIELLPDGNIVSTSSTGNYLTVFKTDTINYPENIYAKKTFIRFGHGIVWDLKRQVLWATAMNQLVAFKYNNDCNKPDLIRTDSLILPGNQAHELFPVFNEDALWLTTADNTFKFIIPSGKFQKSDIREGQNIKSISSGPGNYPVIIIRPKEQWWTDEVLDINNNSIFRHEGYKIYKARWFTVNTFSYDKNSTIHLCK